MKFLLTTLVSMGFLFALFSVNAITKCTGDPVSVCEGAQSTCGATYGYRITNVNSNLAIQCIWEAGDGGFYCNAAGAHKLICLPGSNRLTNYPHG